MVAYLSEVQFENIADVMWWTLGQLHQLFPILKGLAQLLYAGLHTVDSVNALQDQNSDQWLAQGFSLIFVVMNVRTCVVPTFIVRALLSISEMHLVMMKGMPSLVLLATWENSLPKSCRRPCSFLWPHWMVRVSRQRLWHDRKHWRKKNKKTSTS